MPSASLDTLYYTLSVSILVVAGFLAWALYEIARLMRQTNQMVADTRARISRMEQLVDAIAETFGSTAKHLALIATWGRRAFQPSSFREPVPSRMRGRGVKRRSDTFLDELEEEKEAETQF